MDEKYLSSFADQESALSYTGGGDNNLISPQVSLIEGDTELVYSKEIPHGSKIKFERDETTGKLYFVVDGVYFTVNGGLFPIPVPQVNYNAIDLGLPSGLKWADRNVGASSPSDYGSYFSWGNVEGVTHCNGVSMSDDEILTLVLTSEGVPPEMIPSYIEEIKQQEGWENEIDMVLSQISTNDVVGYSFDKTTYASTPGGQFTGSSTLDAEHDAATINMGGDWRMPTSAETMELVNNTTQTVDELNGVSGMTFTSKTNGNSIFIPFAGTCINSGLALNGYYGAIWSSSVDEDDSSGACRLRIERSGSVSGDGIDGRYAGLYVRGVLV